MKIQIMDDGIAFVELPYEPDISIELKRFKI